MGFKVLVFLGLIIIVIDQFCIGYNSRSCKIGTAYNQSSLIPANQEKKFSVKPTRHRYRVKKISDIGLFGSIVAWTCNGLKVRLIINDYGNVAVGFKGIKFLKTVFLKKNRVKRVRADYCMIIRNGLK